MPIEPSDAQLTAFVVREARLLDERKFDQWYDLFADDGIYWVPLTPGQTDPILQTSLAYEDKLLLKIRIDRLASPHAYSQQPPSRGHHVLQMPEVELRDAAANRYVVRTPFLYTESQGDEQRQFAATAWHTLRWADARLWLVQKRVDLLNSDAALPSIQLFP